MNTLNSVSTDSNTVFDLHAQLLSALAHPTRLEIIQLLRGQSLNVSQVVQMLGVRQPLVSQHLMVLREAGVLVSEKLGKENYYRVTHPNFTKAVDLMRDVLRVNLPDSGEPTVTDPICHMNITPKTAAHIYTYDGVRHYFCGKGCLNEFIKTHRRLK